LDWSPSTDPDLAGYKVYYQANYPTIPFSSVSNPVDVGNVTSTVIDGLDPNITHYFAVTVYNTAGLESDFSNVIQVSEAIPPTVSLSAPLGGTTIHGVVAVQAAASDNVAVSKVDFLVNGSTVAEVTAAPYRFSWDTSSLANGNYTLSAKAYDAAGNEGDSAPVTVTVFGDVTPPVPSFSNPAAGASLSGSVTIVANAQDDVGVSRIEIYLDGTMVQTGNLVPASYTWNTLASANGSHTLSALAYDAAGNVGSVTLSALVVNDTTAPAVLLAQPLNGSTVGGNVQVAATATDNVGVTKVEFLVNGALQSTASGAPYSFTWNTAVLANGSYQLTAKAYDAAGNVGQSAAATVTVFNDTTAPSVSLSAPLANSTVTGVLTVSASASDNVAVTKVEFYVNGVLKATSTGAPYAFSWNTAQLANGACTLSAKAYDAAGNVGQSPAVAVNVSNDLVAPAVISFSLPSVSKALNVAVLGFSASDNIGVTGYLITESATAPSAATAGWRATAPTSFTFSAAGSRTGYAWVKDAAGNVSASSSAPVLIDLTLPSITSISLSKNSSSVSFRASASDNISVTRMQLYVDNVLQKESSSGSISATWTVTYKGTHTLVVKAYDAAGNVRSQSVSFNK
jgi:hypothetical protein